jgi:ABC-type transporter Mla maintaining outer membrane lipid asymmetry ATPase subunit MlaF
VRKRDNTAMLIVTHDTREARRVGDRVGILNNGSLIAMGRMDELEQNQNALVRALVSEAQ